MVLLSTQLTLVDGVFRSIADIVHTNFASARDHPLSFWYALVAGAWILLGCFLTYVLGRPDPVASLSSHDRCGQLRPTPRSRRPLCRCPRRARSRRPSRFATFYWAPEMARRRSSTES